MKNLISFILLLSFIFIACGQNTDKSKIDKQGEKEDITTYYFIRHSEKDRSDINNDNPDLTENGIKRANNWAQELADVNFDAIYSTDFNRTRQTAAPLAAKNKLEVKIYDPNSMNDQQFQQDTKGKTVLVVGHSNTTPAFANAVLEENKYEDLADDNNGALFIVTIKDGVAASELRQVN